MRSIFLRFDTNQTETHTSQLSFWRPRGGGPQETISGRTQLLKCVVGGIEKHACGACLHSPRVCFRAVTAVGCVHVPRLCKHSPSMSCDLGITQAGFWGVFPMNIFVNFV